MSKHGLKIVVRGCHNLAPFLSLIKNGATGLPREIELAPLPCTGKIEPHQVVKFFEQGADGALILACPMGACHFIEGNVRAAKRVAYAGKWLEELGIEPNRAGFQLFDPREDDTIVDIIEEFYAAVKELGPTNVTGDSAAGGKK
ncbi:MAG: hydrogenase iron-sulfur subunit [Deltaproteobacteria bacterium]|nr:hydrogenase iron-sulfur subunit [Deltaproteobacteria bacterium]